MNEGLIDNHSVLGLHLGGNEIIIDSLGFINKVSQNEEIGREHVLQRIGGTLKTGKRKRDLEMG